MIRRLKSLRRFLPQRIRCDYCLTRFWAWRPSGDRRFCSPMCEDLQYAWLCVCGHYQEDGLHCDRCGHEPPWGCDCSWCNERYAEGGDDWDYVDDDYWEDY